MASRLIALVLLYALAGSVAGEELLRLAGLQIVWPEGFDVSGPTHELPMKVYGPDGEVGLLSVMRRKSQFPESERGDALKAHIEFATQQLPQLARNEGDVVFPLSRETLANGDTLYVTGTATSSFFGGEGFFIQFLMISRPEVIALITVEGKGKVQLALPKFRRVLDSALWYQ